MPTSTVFRSNCQSVLLSFRHYDHGTDDGRTIDGPTLASVADLMALEVDWRTKGNGSRSVVAELIPVSVQSDSDRT